MSMNYDQITLVRNYSISSQMASDTNVPEYKNVYRFAFFSDRVVRGGG